MLLLLPPLPTNDVVDIDEFAGDVLFILFLSFQNNQTSKFHFTSVKIECIIKKDNHRFSMLLR